MIVSQPRELLFAWLAPRARIQASECFRAIGWVSKNDLQLKAVVGYNSWVGRTVQMHVAIDDPAAITPGFVRAAFEYPFVQCGMDYVLAPVNSTNTRAMNLDLKLGFKEVHRIPKCQLDDGDLVLLQMSKKECRWIKHGLPTVARGEEERGPQPV